MALSKRNKLLALLGGAGIALLSGCGTADYMNNWDTSSARTGNANQANTAIQTIQTWPPSAYRTPVGSGG